MMNETEKNLLSESRARLVVALRAFCKEEGNHEPCLNFKRCDECEIESKIKELKDELFWSV